MSEERWARSRSIAAPGTAVFAVLADPTRHHETEPGDWVRDPVDPAPITHVGQVFGMNMYHERIGGHYVMVNRVSVFEPPTAIGWHPGGLDAEGAHEAMGWSWRYDLDDTGDATTVTLTYDWSQTPQTVRDQVGTPPPFPVEFLDASLAALERAATG